jgi:hypothetical protein
VDETVACRHCGAKTYTPPWRQPVTYVEREDDEQRVFLIIGAAQWLLHRCEIPEDQP